jgi:hypothetical protein
MASATVTAAARSRKSHVGATLRVTVTALVCSLPIVSYTWRLLRDNTSGTHNTALGYLAGINLTTGSYNIDIANAGSADESFTIRIGSPAQKRTFISGIREVTTANANAIPVLIDSYGQLGTASSSERFKKEIKPMEKASEAILSLSPVTFQYKNDNTATPQFGLIAEEVARVNPDLVVRDSKGAVYSVRYDAVNAMLLNEFLKEHRKVEKQEASITQLTFKVAKQEKEFQGTIARQQSEIQTLTVTFKKQAAEIERVNARLEASNQRLDANGRVIRSCCVETQCILPVATLQAPVVSLSSAQVPIAVF